MTGARKRARSLLKRLERAARGLLLRLAAWTLRTTPRPVVLPPGRPLRLLVLRLDPRLGNVLLTTPLLSSLRKRFADAAIDVVVHPYAARVLHEHPDHVRLLALRRLSLWGREGPLRRLLTLRRQAYDLCIDATNPTDPSATQAWLARLCGAAHCIGYDVSPFAPLYTARVSTAAHEPSRWHEIDRRLALLAPLGDGPLVRHPSVGPLSAAARPAMTAFLQAMHGRAMCVINLGARASARRVSVADGAIVANVCASVGLCPVLVAGREEGGLCAEVARLSIHAVRAPDANLADLTLLLGEASVFVSGDTGPMHLAVALGCPTLGLFSSTCPHRYGHAWGPHDRIDVRGLTIEQWTPMVRAYLLAHRPGSTSEGPHKPSFSPRARGPRRQADRANPLAVWSTQSLS